MTRNDRGDPELGGWRPLKPGEMPGPKGRPDYRTWDPFGYEDMGGVGTKRSRGIRRTRTNVVRPEDEQKDALRRRYRERARDHNWEACRQIAHELLASRLTDDERADALYALGFAEERFQNIAKAKHWYSRAVAHNGRHHKALRRLDALNRIAR